MRTRRNLKKTRMTMMKMRTQTTTQLWLPPPNPQQLHPSPLPRTLPPQLTLSSPRANPKHKLPNRAAPTTRRAWLTAMLVTILSAEQQAAHQEAPRTTRRRRLPRKATRRIGSKFHNFLTVLEDDGTGGISLWDRDMGVYWRFFKLGSLGGTSSLRSPAFLTRDTGHVGIEYVCSIFVVVFFLEKIRVLRLCRSML